MKDILKIAGAFVGFIVGAGFASGQELLQFFVSFGLWGLLGTALSTVLFIALGMTLASYGSQLKATSHKQVVDAFFGNWLSKPIDALMMFFMFAITVVMIAGAGSLLEQITGIPATYGSVLATVAVILATWLKSGRVIGLISIITPLLIVMVFVVGTYAVLNKGADFGTLAKIAEEQPKASSNWVLAALLYVSYNVSGGLAILAISGGAVKSPKQAALGGLVGGVVLGALMFLICLALISQIDVIATTPMPMVAMASNLSPAVSYGLSLVVFLMIFNTAVGALYSFSSRVVTPNTNRFRGVTLAIGILAFLGSMFGFINLVGMVYPIFGYIGFVLIAAVGWTWFKHRKLLEEVPPVVME